LVSWNVVFRLLVSELSLVSSKPFITSFWMLISYLEEYRMSKKGK
jgi:hypothetical protein